jgi:hypothetical protein
MVVQGGVGVGGGGGYPVVALDVRGCPRNGLVELMVRPDGPVVGSGEGAACLAPVSEAAVVETAFGCGSLAVGALSIRLGVGEALAGPLGGRIDAGEVAIGRGDRALKLIEFGRQLGRAGLEAAAREHELEQRRYEWSDRAAAHSLPPGAAHHRCGEVKRRRSEGGVTSAVGLSAGATQQVEIGATAWSARPRSHDTPS